MELKQQLKTVLATVFSLQLKAANFHWNVEGENFYQLHQLFGEIYSGTNSAIDPLAEQCRALGTYAPGSLKRFAELTKIEDALTPLPSSEMVKQLLRDNETVIALMTECLQAAEEADQQGLINFLGARIEQHKKWSWFLRATSK